ncbi:hypothetical protein AB28_3135 [Raoultella ornithinolytica 2-156-04_S1_C2]|nr:hypothetical protein AB28_3135 [Raoultella ornithinolytica 2-156-04_S1_C2]
MVVTMVSIPSFSNAARSKTAVSPAFVFPIKPEMVKTGFPVGAGSFSAKALGKTITQNKTAKSRRI